MNGRLVAQSPNPAISCSLLAEVCKWMNEKASLEDVVVRLRPRTVPNGYEYHTWKAGTIVNLTTTATCACILQNVHHNRGS